MKSQTELRKLFIELKKIKMSMLNSRMEKVIESNCNVQILKLLKTTTRTTKQIIINKYKCYMSQI